MTQRGANFVWNPRTYQLALERDANNTVLRRYTYGADRISMTIPGTGDFYYHADRQNSVLALTNSNGTLQRQYTYEPYGRTRTTTQNSPTAPTNPIQWLGEYNETGPYHLRARQYDPETRQFTRPDPASSTAFSATYTYAGANPMVFVDPYGTWSISGGLDWVGDHAGDISAVLGVAALVAGASGVGAPAAPILGAASLAFGVYAAVDSARDAYNICTGNTKGSCPSALVNASLNTALAIPGASALRAPARAANAARSARTGARRLVGDACSFAGNTKILMGNGTLKAIKDIRPGDSVAAGDTESGRDSARKVLSAWVHQDDLYKLVIGGQAVTTTDNHPFWNATNNTWERADQLEPGDLVRTPNGGHSQVDRFDRDTIGRAPAYNLTVQGIHTYYVLAGNIAVLVHNTGPFCGVPFGKNAAGDADFHGSDYSLDEMTEFVYGHTGGGNPAMGRPGRSQIEDALRNAGPVKLESQNAAKFEHNGVRVIINYDMPWKSTAYFPGR